MPRLKTRPQPGHRGTQERLLPISQKGSLSLQTDLAAAWGLEPGTWGLWVCGGRGGATLQPRVRCRGGRGVQSHPTLGLTCWGDGDSCSPGPDEPQRTSSVLPEAPRPPPPPAPVSSRAVVGRERVLWVLWATGQMLGSRWEACAAVGLRMALKAGPGPPSSECGSAPADFVPHSVGGRFQKPIMKDQ